MATVPTKTRRKVSSFLDCVNEAIYLFGQGLERRNIGKANQVEGEGKWEVVSEEVVVLLPAASLFIKNRIQNG
jgi:hypothetical protein